MLLLLYPDASIADKIVENPATAPIPDLHKAMYAWVEKFVRRSWEMDASDIQQLRDAGAADKDIVEWAQIASSQTWWVMMGDGGGVTLDGDMEVGPVVGHERAWYEKSPEGLLAAAPGATVPNHSSNGSDRAWTDTAEKEPAFNDAAAWAEERYGFVPNLLTATSLAPATLPRHRSALELLEGPQSDTITPRQHALVRAMVSGLNRCAYSAKTTKANLERFSNGEDLYAKVTGPWDAEAWDGPDRVILTFAQKATRSAYKITPKDAQAFRDAGLGDEGYVEVLNVAAIQTSLDRLANSLGVTPDESPILPLESVGA